MNLPVQEKFAIGGRFRCHSMRLLAECPAEHPLQRAAGDGRPIASAAVEEVTGTWSGDRWVKTRCLHSATNR